MIRCWLNSLNISLYIWMGSTFYSVWIYVCFSLLLEDLVILIENLLPTLSLRKRNVLKGGISDINKWPQQSKSGQSQMSRPKEILCLNSLCCALPFIMNLSLHTYKMLLFWKVLPVSQFPVYYANNLNVDLKPA